MYLVLNYGDTFWWFVTFLEFDKNVLRNNGAVNIPYRTKLNDHLLMYGVCVFNLLFM